MTTDSNFTPKSLSASEYVLALFEPTDNVAVLARNRRTARRCNESQRRKPWQVQNSNPR